MRRAGSSRRRTKRHPAGATGPAGTPGPGCRRRGPAGDRKAARLRNSPGESSRSAHGTSRRRHDCTETNLKIALFNDTSDSRHFGCTLVMNEVERHLSARGATIVWRAPTGQDWRAAISSLPAGINAVIVNGEGTIHHTATNARARSLVEVAGFARERLRVPSFLVNATLHDIAPPELLSLRAFEAIYVRDTASRDELMRAGIESEVVADLAVGARLDLQARDRSGICGSDSVISEIARAIRCLCRRRNWPYWPMTYRFRTSPKRWPTLDGSFPAFARTALGLADPVAVFSRFISRRALVVTGRYHAVAYCLATRTPFVAVESNTPKISSMVVDAFGLAERVVPVQGLDSLDFDGFAGWRGSEHDQLTAFLQRARSAADRAFDRICAVG